MPDSISTAPISSRSIPAILRNRPWLPKLPALVLALGGSLLLAGSTARAQSGFDLDIRLIEELSGIQETLDRVVTLLERQTMQRDHELLLRRVELGDRRVAPLEDALQRARERRDSILTEQRELEVRLQHVADLLDSGELDLEVDALENETHFVDQQLRSIEVRLGSADNGLIELENELARRREDVRLWQDRLDRLLSDN